METFYYPDFDSECRICGTSPCVVVAGHSQPKTELCGFHFFHSREMIDHEVWNEAEIEE
jgi:hypothetical protein